MVKKLLPLLMLCAWLGLAAHPARAAEDAAKPDSLLVPVTGVAVTLIGSNEKPVGQLLLDLTIEAADPPSVDLIKAYMPRIRDAFLTRVPPESSHGLNITAQQMDDTLKLFLTLARQAVGKPEAVVDVHVTNSFALPT